MNTKPEEKDQSNYKSPSRPIGDTIENGVTSFLAGFLTLLCHAVQTTPSSIMKQNPNVRPNSPPASGGVSSIGY